MKIISLVKPPFDFFVEIRILVLLEIKINSFRELSEWILIFFFLTFVLDRILKANETIS